MKIAILAGFAKSLINFRGQLLATLVNEGHTVIACAPGFDEATEHCLHEMGVLCQEIQLERTGMNLLKDLQTLFFLKNLLRKLKPDIMLCYTIKPVIYGSMAARLAGVSSCYSIITGLGYTFGNKLIKQRLLNLVVRGLYKIGLANNQKVFFQNPDDLHLFRSLRLVHSGQAILINGSGVDLNYFEKAPSVKNRLIFLLIARLIKEKGIIDYVEAANLIKKIYPSPVFRLAGPSDTKPTAISQALIHEWQQEGVIEYLGVLNDVRPAIAEASVYVLPSYREGTPRSVLEAMAMGRPIITTDAPGCRETVIHGYNGYLVPVNDVKQLADTMEIFIQNPKKIITMGKNSRILAEKKYDVHKINAVILKNMGLTDYDEASF